MQVHKPKQGYKLVKSLFGKYEEIPEDWKLDSLNNLKVKTSSGGTPSREKSEYYTGEIPWVKSGELEDNFIEDSQEKITQDALKNSSAKIFPRNTVLVAMYGATIGKTAILMIAGTTNQAVCAIPPNDTFNQYFLQQYLIRNRRIIVTFGMGAGQPNISQELIRNFKYLVPPLKEQQKIASISSNVDSLIQQTQKIIEQTQLLKKGVMQKLLTRGIGHTKFKKVKFLYGKYEEIPEEWNILTIQDFTSLHKQGFYTDQSYVTHDGTKLIRITDLHSPKISYDSMPLLSLSKKIIEQFSVSKGDVLFARTGAIIGTFGIVTENIPCVFAAYLIRFRFDSTVIMNEFFGFAYTANYVMKQQNMIRQGSSNININAENIKSIKIILPPIHEQQKIVSILSKIDYKIQYFQENKSKLETLKKGLMQKLLTGQIRVKVQGVT